MSRFPSIFKEAKMVHSLIPYALLAVGLGAVLALFLSLKREMHASATRSRRRFEELAARVTEADTRPRDPVFIPASATPRSGMNLSKRVQAMRMLRRNEDVSHVAAALGITRSEVELLIRVQGITRAAAGKAIGKAASQSDS